MVRWENGKHWLFAAALVAAVFLAYRPAWQGGFIWDDDLHLLNNPVLKPGGLITTWIPGSYVNYWPITAMAYRLQFELWGLKPVGFHMVNIALHALSAIMVWRILAHLRVPGAMFAAALFALHPVNVESVAWITQLKNILSLLLTLVAVLFYLRHERYGGRWRFALSLGAFCLATLSKGMTLTLPAVLLACDWWQQGRISRRDLLRVVPFFLIGLAMAGMEVSMQQFVASTDSELVRNDGFLSRTAVAGCAVWFYAWKLIWPFHLLFVYPRWTISDRNLLSYLPGMLLALLLALAWWRRNTWGRPLVMLLVCYVALLLPALGFVNVYFMRYSLVADHWQYAAMIVPCAVFAGVATTLFDRWRWGRPAGWVLGLAVLAIMAGLTFRQSGMYRDVEALYRTTIDGNPACSMAHNNLGLAMADRGQVDEAITHYRKALKIDPDNPQAHNNLGLALAGRGQVDQAVTHYQEALRIKPDFAEAHNNFGMVLVQSGRFDEAIAHFQQALKIKPDYADAHNNLGNTLAGRGRVNEAIAHFRKALEIKPDFAEAHYDFGLALAGCGQVDAAIAQYQKALEIKPDFAEAQNILGNALADRGQVDEAIAHYRKALEIKPNFAEAHNNFGVVLVQSGRFDEAIAHFQQALKIKPDNVDAHNNLGNTLYGQGKVAEAVVQWREAVHLQPNQVASVNQLAWVLATCPQASVRNGAEAVELAQRAVRISDGREPAVFGTLAAAYAEAGRFPEAVQAAHKARELAVQQNKHPLAESIGAKIPLYEAGTPFREPQSTGTQY